MRQAFAVLGVGIITVLFAGYVLLQRAHAPEAASTDTPLTSASSTPMSLTLLSSVFENNGDIPSAYTCEGENINPPLSISHVPTGTQSLVLIVEDPDIPNEVKQKMNIDVFDHWTYYNISPDTTEIPAGVEGGANMRDVGYTGPCPPSQYKPKRHRYVFTLYALDTKLFENMQFIKAPGKQEVVDAMNGHVLEKTTLIGLYEKRNADAE